MRVLGVDCGIALTGWAVLQGTGSMTNKSPSVLGAGVIRTESGLSMVERLIKLYEELISKIEKFHPECAAVESLFFFKNKKTVMTVGQARGVILLAAGQKGLEVYDYTPLQVKQAVTGYGKANKSQVQKMVKTLLHLKELPKPDDMADALGVAICHLNMYREK